MLFIFFYFMFIDYYLWRQRTIANAIAQFLSLSLSLSDILIFAALNSGTIIAILFVCFVSRTCVYDLETIHTDCKIQFHKKVVFTHKSKSPSLKHWYTLSLTCLNHSKFYFILFEYYTYEEINAIRFLYVWIIECIHFHEYNLKLYTCGLFASLFYLSTYSFFAHCLFLAL